MFGQTLFANTGREELERGFYSEGCYRCLVGEELSWGIRKTLRITDFTTFIDEAFFDNTRGRIFTPCVWIWTFKTSQGVI